MELLKRLFLPERDMFLSNVIIAVFISWLLSLLNDSTDAKVTGISFEGCFWNLSHYTTRHNLSDKNDPRHCFDECNNTEYIGLQTQDCFCNATPGAYATERACSYLCPGDRNFLCGSDNNIYVSYYTEQSTIDVDGEFGFVYLRVFLEGVSYRYEINGTNNSTKTRHYICYDDSRKCELNSPGVDMTWQAAKNECLVHNQALVPFRIAMDARICTPTFPTFPDGYLWIGMSWFKPVNTSTTTTSTSTTSTSTTATSTSTTAASTSTTATSTSFTSSKPTLSFKTTTGLRTNHTSDTLQTSKASSSDGINVIAVAVPIAVLAVVILALLALILIYKKRKLCFKDRRDSSEKDEPNSDSLPQIPEIIASKTPSSVQPGSTRAPFQSHYPNGRPITAIERVIQSNHKDDTMINSSAEQHETLKETKIKTLAKGYDGLFDAPAETPVIEEKKDLNIAKMRRKKHNEKGRKDNERIDEDGAEQGDVNLNEVHTKPNDGNIDTIKYIKKNFCDEIVDAPAATLVLEEQTDLQNEGPRKKHRKRKKRKKHKKRHDEQKGIDLGKDEHVDAAAHSL